MEFKKPHTFILGIETSIKSLITMINESDVEDGNYYGHRRIRILHYNYRYIFFYYDNGETDPPHLHIVEHNLPDSIVKLPDQVFLQVMSNLHNIPLDPNTIIIRM